MPTFHRLTAPSYFFTGGGTVPASYDYLNNPADPSVGGSGIPVLFDGKKSGGPNDGTYFVGFGENALSLAVGRIAAALGENTDILDNVAREAIPRAVFTAPVTPGSAVTSIVIADDVFMGVSGTTNTAENRNRLIRIVDGNDNEIEISGVQVTPSLIHDGSNVNQVGVPADGFFANPTVNISPTIPIGMTYRVVYGKRSSYTDVSLVNKGGLFSPALALAGMEGWETHKLFRELHAQPSENQAWNATWDSSIRALASAGLNERYRRATLQPAGFVTGNFNTPGHGANIIRDGRALEVTALDVDLSTEFLQFADPTAASYRVSSQIARTNGGWPNKYHGGDLGLFQEADRRNTTDTNEYVRGNVTGPLLMEVSPRDVRASTLASTAVYTRISTAAVAIANPDSGTSSAARATVQVNASDFVSASSLTAIRALYDLLEVTDNTTNKVIGTYVIKSVSGANRLVLDTLAGAPPNFGAVAANVRLRWLQPTVSVGGAGVDARVQDADAGNVFAGLTVVGRGRLTVDPTVETNNVAPVFFLADYAGQDLSVSAWEALGQAVNWGGFSEPNSTGRTSSIRGKLMGNGSVYSLAGRVKANIFSKRHSTLVAVSNNNFSVPIDPTIFASSGGVKRVSIAASTTNTQVTFSLAGTYFPEAGDVFELLLVLPNINDHVCSVVWPVDFRFAGNDAVIPAYNMSASIIYVWYSFEYVNTPGEGFLWFATRRDY